MEFLAFDFCDSVAFLLRNADLRNLEKIRANFWRKAAGEMIQQRLIGRIVISYRREEWFYSLDVNVGADPKRRFTFDELKKVGRRRLQVKQVLLKSHSRRVSPSSLVEQPSTLEEILEIVKFTNSHLCRLRLTVYQNYFPDDALSRILSLYQNVYIKYITCFDRQKATEDFVKNQLKAANSPIKLRLNGKGWSSDDVRVAVEEFAISKPVRFLSVNETALVFDQVFFKRLFEKSLTESKIKFNGEFSFNFDLQQFKTELQDEAAASALPDVPSDNHSPLDVSKKVQHVVWRRSDGVQVQAIYTVRYIETIDQETIVFDQVWYITIQ